MNIEIPFNLWSKERLKKGKCATSRNSKHGEIGDTFIVDGVTYQITFIIKLPLSKIASEYYVEEGAISPDEFIDVWQSIHPRVGWTPDKKVWIHFFDKVKVKGDE